MAFSTRRNKQTRSSPILKWLDFSFLSVSHIDSAHDRRERSASPAITRQWWLYSTQPSSWSNPGNPPLVWTSVYSGISFPPPPPPLPAVQQPTVWPGLGGGLNLPTLPTSAFTGFDLVRLGEWLAKMTAETSNKRTWVDYLESSFDKRGGRH